MLGELLDGVRRPGVETAARCWGWTLTRDDLPLKAFVRSKLPVRFSVKLMDRFCGMRYGPGQRIRPQTQALRELADDCDDLPEVRARFAIERVAARCDPALAELVKEDPGVRSAGVQFRRIGPDPRVPRQPFPLRRGVFRPCGGSAMRRSCALIDSGRPCIKPAAGLLDCSPAAIRRLRVLEHSAVDLGDVQGLHEPIRGGRLAVEHPPPRFEDRPQWAAILDVPLLLLEGLSGLPADKWPPLESLTSLNVAIAGGLGTDASVRSVICDSFQAARILVEERPGVINPIFPAFRPLLASTRGDCGCCRPPD